MATSTEEILLQRWNPVDIGIDVADDLSLVGKFSDHHDVEKVNRLSFLYELANADLATLFVVLTLRDINLSFEHLQDTFYYILFFMVPLNEQFLEGTLIVNRDVTGKKWKQDNRNIDDCWYDA